MNDRAPYSGWASQRLGHIYHQLEVVADDLPDGSTERGCIADALKAVEQADVHIEKRLTENAA